MGGEMLVAALAWPHFWVIRIGTLLASVGAGLQCLTGESYIPSLYESIAWLSIGEFSALTNKQINAIVITSSVCTA